MQLVFWQNILSPHQAPYLRALANGGHEVTIVTTEAMTEDRRALGWKLPDHGNARVMVAPSEAEVRELIADGSPTVIHVIAGARWTPLGNLASRLCRASGRRLGIITEAPDPRGLSGYGRRIKYTWERFSHGRAYQFVLAMGEMGVQWFRNCGFKNDKIFVFGYTTETELANEPAERSAEPVFLFVGRFVALKGLDVLLRAFALAAPQPARLQMLGEGPEQERLERLVLDLGLSGRVRWLAKRDQPGVLQAMRGADVTVLSSHKDGWGAVVNESLMVGTPVICTDACGAAELLRQPWRGTVVRAGSVESLSQAIKSWTDCGGTTAAERERIRQWTACITGESVAQYFVAVMEHVYDGAPRPEAPWRQ